jgi:chemotaxis signal transduction protein
MNPSALPYESATNAGGRALPLSPIAALDEESLALSAADGVSTAAQQGPSEWLSVRVGPIGLLLPATAGRELLDPPPAARLPHTPSWFAGLANVRGALVPVVDTARALEVEHDADARHYLLVFDHGDEALGLIVDGLPRRQGFEASERLNGLPPHPPLLDGHLAAAYGRDGRLWFELDLEGFFRALGERIRQA